MIRILLVDDHQLFRDGLKRILSEDKSFVVVAEADSVESALRSLKMQDLEVAVVDVSMPGRSGLELVAIMSQCFPKVRVLMLSMHDERQYAVRSLRTGALGYATKDTPAADLRDAIQMVASGKRYVSGKVAQILAEQIGHPSGKEPHERLTPREFEVMLMMARGQKNAQIAQLLRISVKTVDAYRRGVLDKLGFKTNADIVRYALAANLIDQ